MKSAREGVYRRRGGHPAAPKSKEKDQREMNDIAVRPNTGIGLINRDDLAKSLNTAAAQMPAVGGDKQYIKMLTKGRDAGTWVFGQQETEVEADSLWAVNPASIKHGYVAWDSDKGGAPVQEIMMPINRPLPSKDSLPVLPPGTPSKKAPNVPVDLEYADQRSFDAVCISGADEGVTVEYKQSSAGSMKLFSKVVNALLDQVSKGDAIVAVGKWGFSSYDHKTYGEIYNPEFEIVEWRTMDDTSAPEAPAEVAKEEPAPTRQRTRTAAPAAAEAPKDEDAALAEEYAGAAAAEEPAPRRRLRR